MIVFRKAKAIHYWENINIFYCLNIHKYTYIVHDIYVYINIQIPFEEIHITKKFKTFLDSLRFNYIMHVKYSIT